VKQTILHRHVSDLKSSWNDVIALWGAGLLQDPVRIEWIQSSLIPTGHNILRGERESSGTLIKQCEMLFTDGVRTTTVQFLHLFTICDFQWPKDIRIARLELV
jgi:hypothetical protein